MTEMLPVVTLGTTLPDTVPLTPQRLVKLAYELAMDIRPLGDVLKTYDIAVEDFRNYIEKNDFFKRAYQTYVIEWSAASSAQKRIKIKSAAAIEDGLEMLYSRMNDKTEPLPAVVETAKVFSKLAGIGEGDKQGAPGEKFTITIDLGDDKHIKLEKDVTPVAAHSDTEPGNPE